MGGLFLIGLLIVFFSQLWPLLVGGVLLGVLYLFVLVPQREARAREAREREIHAAARREIDRIAAMSAVAMVAVARERGR